MLPSFYNSALYTPVIQTAFFWMTPPSPSQHVIITICKGLLPFVSPYLKGFFVHLTKPKKTIKPYLNNHRLRGNLQSEFFHLATVRDIPQ